MGVIFRWADRYADRGGCWEAVNEAGGTSVSGSSKSREKICRLISSRCLSLGAATAEQRVFVLRRYLPTWKIGRRKGHLWLTIERVPLWAHTVHVTAIKIRIEDSVCKDQGLSSHGQRRPWTSEWDSLEEGFEDANWPIFDPGANRNFRPRSVAVLGLGLRVRSGSSGSAST